MTRSYRHVAPTVFRVLRDYAPDLFTRAEAWETWAIYRPEDFQHVNQRSFYRAVARLYKDALLRNPVRGYYYVVVANELEEDRKQGWVKK